MDASFLTAATFWRDSTPFAAGGFPEGVPDISELRGHVLFETSGSMGNPKWIALSKHALVVSATAVNRHLHVTHHSCWGLALPVRHVGGFGVAARAFEAGCRMEAFLEKWDPRAFTNWLGERHVTHTSLVPTQVHDLVAAGLPAPAGLRAIVVGGGRLETATGRAARDLGWRVLASYGMTEAASQIATQTLATLDAPYQPAPISLLPIWRAKTAPDLAIRIAGPALFSGTLVRESGGWVFQPRVGEWHSTNDRARLENDFLTPIGRADSQVKVLGELVDLERIERELADLSEGGFPPGAFAVVALPDPRAGHVLVPVFDAEVDSGLIVSVLKTYAETAAGFRRLAPVVVLPDFPRSPLGKPRRSELAARIG